MDLFFVSMVIPPIYSDLIHRTHKYWKSVTIGDESEMNRLRWISLGKRIAFFYIDSRERAVKFCNIEL
jgi:hypothetical protein